MSGRKQEIPPQPSSLNPASMMRARHPDLFSDSEVNEEFQLPRVLLDHHLDGLTARKQETEFEYFCRALAEKTICTNLRPQTGPTGGGDSKVDSETYPVAKAIAERWWIGQPEASEERWAFAFSAKKDWRAKVRKDVDSILSTGRPYKRIFFFTNQFAKDSTRSKIEDELTQKAGVPATILDRTWLLDKVYEGDHIALAIRTLNIEGYSKAEKKRSGPRDVAREAELAELDARTQDPEKYIGVRYQLVEDCLQAALLARGLERPRSEVEQRFLLTDRLAQEVDHDQQRMRVAYNRAWTSFWWHESYSEFNKLYDEVERLALTSSQASDLENLTTLRQLLANITRAGGVSTVDAKLDVRSEVLREKLEELAADTSRPANALQAKTDLVLMRLAPPPGAEPDPSSFDETWRELKAITEEAQQIGGYPFERLFDLIEELGKFFDTDAFDDLCNVLIDTRRERQSEGEAGKAYITRGLQKLDHKKPYDAIRWFGRAERLVVKEEYRRELILSLMGSSYAYERVGLLWAARAKAVTAAERALDVYIKSGSVTFVALRAAQRLLWLELQIGRIPHILSAFELADSLAAHLTASEGMSEKAEKIGKERQTQEAILGMHFMNAPQPLLPVLVRLPDALTRLNLELGRMALLFALQGEAGVREDGYIPESESSQDVADFFGTWCRQPARKDILDVPILADGPTVDLNSNILGCSFVVTAPSTREGQAVAESLLGALEAFFATSTGGGGSPFIDRLPIEVIADQKLKGAIPTFEFDDTSGLLHGRVRYPVPLTFDSADDLRGFQDWLFQTIVQVIVRITFADNAEAWLERLGGDEKAFARAVGFGNMIVLGSNLFGKDARVRLADWIEPADKTYAVSTEPSPPAAEPSRQDKEPVQFGEGEPPEGLHDLEAGKHTDRRIISSIDPVLWSRARWRGTLFAEDSRLGTAPILGLAFEDIEAGKLIFKGWAKRFGNEDRDNQLRVAIITGIANPSQHSYSVIVGSNIELESFRSQKQFFTVVSRFNRMDPRSPENLTRFLSTYGRAGAFLLVPAHIKDGQIGEDGFFPELGIRKHHLTVKPAWQIGENDPDSVVLDADEMPVIPTDVTDAPVLKAIESVRRRRVKRA